MEVVVPYEWEKDPPQTGTHDLERNFLDREKGHKLGKHIQNHQDCYVPLL